MLSEADSSLLDTLVEADAARTIAQNPKSTIEPRTLGANSATQLALNHFVTGAHITTGLELGATLGEGGMGIVRTATQLSLGRRVAVKTLRPAAKSEDTTLRLLREAWVTGALEHPNIVPVYDLGFDAQGTPFIVLKQIEGLPWSDLIGDPVGVKARFGADDLLEQNLRILAQVCHAVSLAHARGVLHRDLKPENVMIGAFGEVYLVDWGIAVSLREDPTGRLPLASAANELAGTPAYMAPEMLGAMGPLSERTDVYLLGAILFEILTARTPHQGAEFRQIAASILLSTPQFPPGVPKELAAIATRAMSRVPEDRYASASELRERLEWYLRHRGSLALSAEAALRVDELRSLLTSGSTAAELRDRVHHLFAEARFGFRQAIRACDDNAAARAGLREVTEMVVAFELERGAAEAAAAALAELEAPPTELAQRVAMAMSAREEQKSRMVALEKLSEDLDPSVGRRTRMMATVFTSLIWILVPQFGAWADRRYPDRPYWTLYGMSLFMILCGAVVYSWARESMTKTAFNRRARAAVVMGFAMQLTSQVGGHLLELSGPSLIALQVYGWACTAVAFYVLVEPGFALSAFGSVLAFFVTCVWPAQAWNAQSLAGALITINAVSVWLSPSDDSKYLAERLRSHVHGDGSARE
jgi:serine/threonine-protein kinase